MFVFNGHPLDRCYTISAVSLTSGPLTEANTRMHSSTMRTAHSLTVSRCIRLGGGVAQPVNRMTHRCKNITSRQTSFADGNKYRQEVWDLFFLNCSCVSGSPAYICNVEPTPKLHRKTHAKQKKNKNAFQ